MRPGIGGVDGVRGVLGHTVLAHEWLHEAMRMGHVIEAEAALDAEPVLVGGAVAAPDAEGLVILDVVGGLAPHAPIPAYALDLPDRELEPHICLCHTRRGH